MLLENSRQVYLQGWRSIKLYFMVGLPSETDASLQGIVDLAQKIREVGRPGQAEHRARQPFHFCSQEPHAFPVGTQINLEQMQAKIQFIRNSLRGIKVSWQEPKLSLLEGVFTRGDRRLGEVLYRAWKKGCLFDAWSERLNWGAWQEAFAETGLDQAFYASRMRGENEVFPWDRMDCGTTKEFLWAERQKAYGEQTREDCRGPVAIPVGLFT